MNRTGIEWATWTWNPVTGCLHGCTWCYARRMAKRLRGRFGYPETDPFYPTLHEDRLNDPLKVKKPARIFAVSMGDLFGTWVPISWMKSVMDVIEKAHWHQFIILTKDPLGVVMYDCQHPLPTNLWIGTSVEDRASLRRLKDLALLDHPYKFISFEPLLEDVTLSSSYSLKDLRWVIVGAQTGPGAKEPPWMAVKGIGIDAIYRGIPFFAKDSLKYVYPVQEYPEELII